MLIGGSRYERYYRPQPSEEELLGPIPAAPVFDPPLEELEKQVSAKIGKRSVPKALDLPHPVVAKLLQQDERKRERNARYSFALSWNIPCYDSAIQQRRLRILSAILFATAPFRCRADTYGPTPTDAPINDFYVMVGDQTVRLRAAVVEITQRIGKGAEAKVSKAERIRISLDPSDEKLPDGRFWEDDDRRIEQKIRVQTHNTHQTTAATR